MIGLLAMVTAAATSPDRRCAMRVGFHQPPHGIISMPNMAAQVAQIYLTAIYGADVIGHELPLKVSLLHEVWHVTGKDLPVPTVGGVADIELCQSTGQVLRVIHGE